MITSKSMIPHIPVRKTIRIIYRTCFFKSSSRLNRKYPFAKKQRNSGGQNRTQEVSDIGNSKKIIARSYIGICP